MHESTLILISEFSATGLVCDVCESAVRTQRKDILNCKEQKTVVSKSTLWTWEPSVLNCVPIQARNYLLINNKPTQREVRLAVSRDSLAWCELKTVQEES